MGAIAQWVSYRVLVGQSSNTRSYCENCPEILARHEFGA